MPNLPERVPIKVGGTVRMGDIEHMLPEKYTRCIRDNTALDACCRACENHQVEFFKTHDDAPGPDLMVCQCSCGKKHYRMAASGGRNERV